MTLSRHSMSLKDMKLTVQPQVGNMSMYCPISLTVLSGYVISCRLIQMKSVYLNVWHHLTQIICIYFAYCKSRKSAGFIVIHINLIQIKISPCNYTLVTSLDFGPQTKMTESRGPAIQAGSMG